MKLRKRKNEKSTSWLIDWTDRAGKRRRKVIGITDKKTAELAFAEFQLKLERGEVNLPTDEQMTLSEALEDRIEERKAAGCVPEWISRLGHYRDHLVRYFGPEMRFLSLGDAVVVQYRNSRLAEGAAVETVNKELSFLGAAGRLAVSTSKIAQLPWSKLERAVDRGGDQAWNFLESDEIDRLLDVLRLGCPMKVTRSNGRNYETRRPPSPNLWKMVVFLLNTGARRGEMFRLRWSDVDLARGRVRLVSTKSARPGSPAKTRYIPFNAALDELFQGLNRGQGSELVFGRDRNLRQKFKAALRAAGLRTSIRIHDLRHTFASHLVMNGVPLYTVSELLGHSSTHMTRRYAHLAPETLESAVAKLNFGERPDGARVLNIRG